MEEIMFEQIKNYIQKNIMDDDEIELCYETPLYSDGLLSSMGHLKLLNFLERTFNVSIPQGDISLENFDSINQIVHFLNEKSM